MPFSSKAQARYLFMKDPAVAKEFASKTKSIKSLPEHVSNKNKSMKAKMVEGSKEEEKMDKKLGVKKGGKKTKKMDEHDEKFVKSMMKMKK